MAQMLSDQGRPLADNPLGALTGLVGAGSGRRLAQFVDKAVKRAVDIAGASLLLLVLSPVMLAIAVIIRLTSPGPALFQQVRLGRRLSPFVIWKFRTMYADNDDAIHRTYVTSMLTKSPVATNERGTYKLTGDPRVTAVGRFIRKTSLDELPQLINVLSGDMSLVGPRPVLPWEAELFEPRHHVRFAVKPGITGLWQVSGRSSLTMQQALDLDVEYVRRRNLTLDLLTLLRTIPTVLLSRGAC
jgi:lipopolysaccharide/colanic/teichoic acid biosynthesis glycosyltransferase